MSAMPDRSAPTGVERIAEAFASARADGRRAALMPYLMGGFPDLDTSARIGVAYAESGADLIELGVPFSDPLADGPVIHAAGTKALRGGASLPAVLEVGGADRRPTCRSWSCATQTRSWLAAWSASSTAWPPPASAA